MKRSCQPWQEPSFDCDWNSGIPPQLFCHKPPSSPHNDVLSFNSTSLCQLWLRLHQSLWCNSLCRVTPTPIPEATLLWSRDLNYSWRSNFASLQAKTSQSPTFNIQGAKRPISANQNSVLGTTTEASNPLLLLAFALAFVVISYLFFYRYFIYHSSTPTLAQTFF